MSDFSLAAIARLIPLGLARQGIRIALPRPPSNAHLPLADKRHLLQMIAANHGERALVRVGEGVFDAPDEPALSALMLANDPHDLISRWQRLERFAHSKHRTTIDHRSDDSLALRHVSVEPDTQPTREEDLLVFGILVALLEKIGAACLAARLDGDSSWRFENKQWGNNSWPDVLSTWVIKWQPGAASDSPPTRVDAHEQPADWAGLVQRALSQDPGRGWTLATVSAVLGTSPRSLQRKLGERQTRFSQLLAQVRSGRAAQLLTGTEQSAAEIGYSCGYADQAHFNREFKRYSALTPLAYRDQFKKD